MKAIHLILTALLSAILLYGASPASAASLTEAQIMSQLAGSGVVKVQGYYDGRGYGAYGNRRYHDDADDEDEDDEDDSHDRYAYRGGRDVPENLRRRFCDTCERRCARGYCPPPCSTWVKQYRCEY